MTTFAQALLCFGAAVTVFSCQTPHPAGCKTLSVNVMSFNIRYDNPNDGENAWSKRRALVAHTMQFHQAALVGLQEALKSQLDELSTLMPAYAWVGCGRDDGKEGGEYSAILYLKGRFELLASGTFWLSETPERAGSMGWDAAITRIATWARFKDRHSGKVFYHFNTHFDHVGERAREESAKLLLEKIRSLAAATAVIVTGDFNAAETSLPYQTLTGKPLGGVQKTEPLLFDARKKSELQSFGPDYTFHGFGQAAERTRIDHIFVSTHFSVLRHAAISDACEGRYASDHLPVLAEVVLE